MTEKYYILAGEDRGRIEATMKRLYTEERLSGDEMRNLAQRLHVVLDNLMDFQEPKPAKRQPVARKASPVSRTGKGRSGR